MLVGLGDAAATKALINQMAPSYGVPTSIAQAVAQKESNYNQSAVGSSGEVGVFQLMPATAKSLGVQASDLNQNVQGGLTLLSQLYNQYGNWDDALQAYNGGPGSVGKPVVQAYASDVLAKAGMSTPSPSDSVDSGGSWDQSQSEYDSSGNLIVASSSGSGGSGLGIGVALAAVAALALLLFSD